MSIKGDRTEGQVLSEQKEKVKEPSQFRVLLHNDNFTTMEFVVYVLMKVFHKPEEEAFRIMLEVHTTGIGVAGTYSYEIAEMKAHQTIEMARSNDFPLLCTIDEI